MRLPLLSYRLFYSSVALWYLWSLRLPARLCYIYN